MKYDEILGRHGLNGKRWKEDTVGDIVSEHCVRFIGRFVCRQHVTRSPMAKLVHAKAALQLTLEPFQKARSMWNHVELHWLSCWPSAIGWSPRCLEWGSGKYYLQAPTRQEPMMEAVWLARDGGRGFAWRRCQKGMAYWSMSSSEIIGSQCFRFVDRHFLGIMAEQGSTRLELMSGLLYIRYYKITCQHSMRTVPFFLHGFLGSRHVSPGKGKGKGGASHRVPWCSEPPPLRESVKRSLKAAFHRSERGQ